ncbi:beta-galactosidase-1-like protein 2 isoform X1 [Scleropages formosus]|uniref:beta-galactosidase-1-like protein 2 isoform X1 n=1 Tax=Scleropages formosus TaxID=113540 RepID=UPI0010FA82C3|nr:beta-galactosidase-1-like protein 2 isoform X1 [Scleropages formosus]
MLVSRVKNHAIRQHRVLLSLVVLGFLIWRSSSRFWFFRVRVTDMPAVRVEGLNANSSRFTLNGEPIRILGGSMHYFRVPRAYWSDRMVKMKACGLNTVTTYVPWNLHEPERGAFKFHGQLELEAFINEAARVGLWVILRPGPYICAEWDLGGLPSWLLRDKNMKLRTTYPGFTAAVNSYLDKLIPRVVPLQYMKGGPIIAFQVENEYGSYGNDSQYMSFIKEALVSRGIEELLVTSDNRQGLHRGGLKGVLKTINLQKIHPEVLRQLEAAQPDRPMMVMEYWSGWFDVWGGLHHVFEADEMVPVIAELLSQGMSINLYMFHGGTNFGFMGGALGNQPYRPMITSYDYDAPLSEAGDYTPKYHRLRTLFRGYQSDNLPMMPKSQQKKPYKAVTVFQHLSLWEALVYLEKPHHSLRPVNMENLPVNNGNGQAYGYTLYETAITSGGTLNSKNNVRDKALVFVDKVFIGVLDYKTLELAVPDGKGERILSLLVENCGRVNFGKDLNNQRKGLVGDIVLNNTPLRNFNIFSLDMKPDFIERLQSTKQWKSVPKMLTYPAFFQGKLWVSGYPADTFIRLSGWSKGVVFINGQNLGRYWSIGPQQTLYLPGPWLKRGVNQVPPTYLFVRSQACVCGIYTQIGTLNSISCVSKLY